MGWFPCNKNNSQSEKVLYVCDGFLFKPFWELSDKIPGIKKWELEFQMNALNIEELSGIKWEQPKPLSKGWTTYIHLIKDGWILVSV